jgi:membrane dipeptidase
MAEPVLLENDPRRFFDAHCDTIIKMLDEGADFVGGTTSTHIDYPRLRSAGVRAQLFACFVLSERYPEQEVERAEAMIAALEQAIASVEEGMRIARTSGDLRAAFDGGPIAAVVGLEGADPLCGKAENLRLFFESGVRDVIFAWKDNPFSGTAFGADTPLTEEGGRLLGLCEELGVMVDVSHLSDTAFAQVCRASTRPFVASHSNCRAVCPSRRNLTDDMIRALADRGGVMGINLATSFLSPESFGRWEMVRARIADERLTWQEAERRAKEEATSVPRPALDWIARHVVHAMDVGGEDVVGLGGDLDGIVHTPEGVDGVEEYPAIRKLLRRAGLSETQVEKICYRNLLRVFSEVLPS